MKKITSYKTRLLLCIILYFGIIALTYLYISWGMTRPGPNDRLIEQLRRAGRRDAEADIAEGRLVIKLYGGEPLGAAHIYYDLLKKWYGLIMQGQATTNYTAEESEYWFAYNKRSEAEITGRFGAAIFDSARAEAERLYKIGERNYQYSPTSSEPVNASWIERDEPYTITVDSVPPVPENLFVKGASGWIRLRLNVKRSGEFSVENIESIWIWNGFFKDEFRWMGYKGMNSAKQDSIKHLLQPWIDKYIAAMHVRIHPRHFRWMYMKEVRRQYIIQIGPQYDGESPATLHVPKVTVPSNIAGPKDIYEAVISIYLDRSGRMVTWRFDRIMFWPSARMNDPKFNGYACFARNYFDTAKVYQYDVFLVKRFTPWVENVISKITYDFNPKCKYYEYFDIAGVNFTLEQRPKRVEYNY